MAVRSKDSKTIITISDAGVDITRNEVSDTITPKTTLTINDDGITVVTDANAHVTAAGALSLQGKTVDVVSETTMSFTAQRVDFKKG